MTLIRIISGVALLSYVILLWLVRRDVRRRETRAFVSFLVAMLVWQAGITGVTWTSDPQTAEAFYRIVLGLGSSFSIFYAQFVREYLRIERHRWLMRLGFSWAIGAGVYILAGGPGVIQSVYPDPNTGLLLPELGPVPYVYGMIIYLFLFYSAFHLIAAHRQERSAILRNRIKYLLTGLSLVFAGSLVNLSDSLKGYPVDMVGNALNAALIAYAILRLKLFDISWVIRKGLVYSGLTLAITIVYFLVMSLAINILHVVTDYQIFLLTLFMAALTAVAILPLRDRVQGWVDRRFFREKHDWSEMLQRLSRTVASVLDLRKVTEMILDDVLQTMHIGSGAFLIRRDEDGTYRIQAYKGDAPVPQSLSLFRADSPVISWLSRYQTSLSSRALDTDPNFIGLWSREREDIRQIKAELFVPLLVRRQLIGILVLGPKLSETPYSFEEQQILDTLANQTAVAIENASLFSVTLAEQERTATIVEQAFAGIILLDCNLRIASLNPAAEAIIGLPAEQVTGQPLSDILGPEIAGDGSSLHQAMLTGQRVAPREETLVCGGRPCDVLLGVAPLKDGFLLSLADITQIKEADRFKSDIVANVSHEFRTPLAIIKAYSELLMDEMVADDAASRREFLSVIDSETNRLTGLVSDLLDLARLEARRGVEEMAPVAIAEVVDEVIAEAQFQANAREVTLDTEVAAALPTVKGNRPLLNTMLRNLVGNAIKFSQPGGTVEIIAESADSSLLLKVTDHGIGISETDLPHLFEKFYRSSTAQEAGIRGTGIGLVLVKQAVDAHHGSISVESHVGSGTRFTVTLPANGATPEAAAHIVELLPVPEYAL